MRSTFGSKQRRLSRNPSNYLVMALIAANGVGLYELNRYMARINNPPVETFERQALNTKKVMDAFAFRDEDMGQDYRVAYTAPDLLPAPVLAQASEADEFDSPVSPLVETRTAPILEIAEPSKPIRLARLVSHRSPSVKQAAAKASSPPPRMREASFVSGSTDTGFDAAFAEARPSASLSSASLDDAAVGNSVTPAPSDQAIPTPADLGSPSAIAAEPSIGIAAMATDGETANAEVTPTPTISPPDPYPAAELPAQNLEAGFSAGG